MNFFAHLVVARVLRREPPFLLGAMLPDFATMCGARLAPLGHDTLAAGVAEHHRTDEAFHATPTFVTLCRETGARLDALGMSWGASRAVAHVGTELFLDGELALHEDAAADYVGAVASAADPDVAQGIAFREAEGRERFERLRARLGGGGAPVRYREPRFVRDVLVSILERRPRLAVPPSHHEVLLDELAVLRERVVSSRDALVGETLEVLARPRAQPSQR